MTDTAVRADQASREHPAHPLAPATAAEYLAGRDIMAAAGLLTEPVRFAYYGLEEPPKDEVLASAATDRRLRAFLVNRDTGESTDVVVSLTHQQIVSARRLDPGKDGQMPILEQRLRGRGRDHQGRPAVARRHGQARLPRRQPDQDLPDHRGRVRAHPTTTGAGWCGCSRSSRPASTTWPGRIPSTASPPTWT